MSRIMIVVEFEVKPEHRNQFIELIKGHAQRSRAEDGCQQFDVLLPQEDHNRVLLVEAWRDQAALDVHSKVADAGARRARPTSLGWSAARRRAAQQTDDRGPDRPRQMALTAIVCFRRRCLQTRKYCRRQNRSSRCLGR